ncbi:hypothetical protein TrLO_g9361 [Triparma laevis f. longispina]|uniref:Uncharacterized protein n=1 Tax=Triparma laevis f. longispina TaxID=1714387 RepID=A0A9W7L039_9STRA|nr:hypothetical protein TrLO_g9361 [Triparma laevis f. longispina]
MKLKAIRLNENLPRYVFAEREYNIPLALFDAKHKIITDVSGAVHAELSGMSLRVKQAGTEVKASGVTVAFKDSKRPLLGFSIAFSQDCANQAYNVSLVHTGTTINTTSCLEGVTVTPVLYMLAVQEFTSKEDVFLPDGAEQDTDCGKRDEYGLRHFQLTWFKDERGRESNYIECRTCIADANGRIMPNTVDLNLEYSLCYCKEEVILKNKGSDQKKSIANSTGSKDDLGNNDTCLRSHLMEEVVDQSILNVLAKGYKGLEGDHDKSMAFSRCRIEEVSKNHQSNFFRIKVATNASMRFHGHLVGSSSSKRIYVKSKRSKPSTGVGGAGKAKRARVEGAPMPPAYLMKAALQSIESWNQKAAKLIQKLTNHVGRSPLAIECSTVLSEYSSVKGNSFDYLSKCIDAIDKASSPTVGDLGSEVDQQIQRALDPGVPGKKSRQSSASSNASATAGGHGMGKAMPLPPAANPQLSQVNSFSISQPFGRANSTNPDHTGMPPPQPTLASQQSLSMNLSLFNEIMDSEETLPISYDPNSEAPPPMNPGLMQKVSSHYIGPGKDARRSETTNLKSTLGQFRSAELAIGSTPSKTPSLDVPPPTEIQQSVYYILAKLWCGNPPYHGGNAIAYGFPAFDEDMNCLGFYREVYDAETDDKDLTSPSNAIGVFIPITDSRELGKKQRAEIASKLAKEIEQRSASVHELKQCEGKLGKLIQEGFTYVWTKLITSGPSINVSGWW